MARVGVVVHPTRPLEGPLNALRGWAALHAVEVVQVPAAFPQPPVAVPGDPGDCELIVSIGGDGTMLAALRTAAVVEVPGPRDRLREPGRADGGPGRQDRGLRSIASRPENGSPAGCRRSTSLTDDGEVLFALNDLAIVRTGQGQIGITVMVDGALFVDFVGDGCIVSTPVGSSAYALAAGGPLLTFDDRCLPDHAAHGPRRLVPAAGGRLRRGGPGDRRWAIRRCSTRGGRAAQRFAGRAADDHVPSGRRDSRRLRRSGAAADPAAGAPSDHRQPTDPRRRGAPSPRGFRVKRGTAIDRAESPGLSARKQSSFDVVRHG